MSSKVCVGLYSTRISDFVFRRNAVNCRSGLPILVAVLVVLYCLFYRVYQKR